MTHTDQYLQEATEIVDPAGSRRHRADGGTCLPRPAQPGAACSSSASAAAPRTASHAVNDFRKLCGIEAYAPTDNVSELTARTNDDGWETVFVEWLKGSRLRRGDAVFVLSVGGGDRDRNISRNLVHALEHARQVGATIVGVVGRDGGYTATVADAVRRRADGRAPSA